MSASVSMATPHFAHLAQRQRVVRVAAHEGGQVERGRQPVAAVGQQLPEPPVGVGRGAEAANMRIVQSFDRYIEAYGPRYTATRRGTRRRPGRRRARPAAPTWCRSRPPAARPARARPASGRVPSSPRQRYRLMLSGGASAPPLTRSTRRLHRVADRLRASIAAPGFGSGRRMAECAASWREGRGAGVVRPGVGDRRYADRGRGDPRSRRPGCHRRSSR